jgi:hypothetical protein
MFYKLKVGCKKKRLIQISLIFHIASMFANMGFIVIVNILEIIFNTCNENDLCLEIEDISIQSSKMIATGIIAIIMCLIYLVRIGKALKNTKNKEQNMGLANLNYTIRTD